MVMLDQETQNKVARQVLKMSESREKKEEEEKARAKKARRDREVRNRRE